MQVKGTIILVLLKVQPVVCSERDFGHFGDQGDQLISNAF